MKTIEEKLTELRQRRWEAMGEISSDTKILKSMSYGLDKTKQIAQCIKSGGDSFDCLILRLISKAQNTPENYFCLMVGFPIHVILWEIWQESDNEQEFFDEYLGSDS